jgi:hypothetical protein
MRELKALIASMPPTPNNKRLLEVYEEYYAAYRSRNQDDVLRGPFIDMHFNNSPHGTHTHLYLEGFIDFHFGAGKGRELHVLLANAEGAAAEGGKPFWRQFFDAMVDEYDPLEINSPDGLQALLRKLLGFPRRIAER